jgi:hypothetical protein
MSQDIRSAGKRKEALGADPSLGVREDYDLVCNTEKRFTAFVMFEATIR